MEPSVYFSPFLDVVRFEDTNATITGMALHAVNKFLQFGLIDHKYELIVRGCGDVQARPTGDMLVPGFIPAH